MLKNNQRFSNPIIKDVIEMLHESEEKLIFRTYLERDGGQSGLHYHTKIIEKFRVIKGELTVILNAEEIVLKRNKEVVIKPFDTHQFFNTSGEEVIFDVEITPASDIIKGLKIFYGLAKDGKTYKNGLPKNIFYTAIGLKLMNAYSPAIPRILQKLGLSILAKLGRIVGLERKILLKYC